jgi:hypothetical protein
VYQLTYHTVEIYTSWVVGVVDINVKPIVARLAVDKAIDVDVVQLIFYILDCKYKTNI